MTRKIVSCVSYLFFIAIIVSSFCIPDLLLDRLTFSFEAAMYSGGSQGSIDVEAEEIYLVKAIHDMETEEAEVYFNVVSVSSPEALSEYESGTVLVEFAQIEEEMLKMQESGVLKDYDPVVDTEMGIMSEIYRVDQSEYTVKNIFFPRDNAVLLMEQEKKTGKMLSVFFNKEDVPKEAERRELLENYIRYLNLYIIDDWSYEDQRMKSQKAQLVVGFEKGGEGCILAIHSRDILFDEQKYMDLNEYKYEKYLKNQYKIWMEP